MSVASPLLSTSTTISAPTHAVWAEVSDLSAMGKRSPQCQKMFVFGKPAHMVGSLTLNLNKRGLLWWPTWSIITEWQKDRLVEFRVPLNGSRWRYELKDVGDGNTELTLQRIVHGDTTKISQILVNAALGGTENFDKEMAEGIEETLAAVKKAVEDR